MPIARTPSTAVPFLFFWVWACLMWCNLVISLREVSVSHAGTNSTLRTTHQHISIEFFSTAVHSTPRSIDEKLWIHGIPSIYHKNRSDGSSMFCTIKKERSGSYSLWECFSSPYSFLLPLPLPLSLLFMILFKRLLWVRRLFSDSYFLFLPTTDFVCTVNCTPTHNIRKSDGKFVRGNQAP